MEKREQAMKDCKKADPQSGGQLLDSCIFDVCFGGEQYAAEDGIIMDGSGMFPPNGIVMDGPSGHW
jgi:hypothetical protein